MKRVLTGHEELFGPWMMSRLDSSWFPGRGSIIGLWDDAKGPVAGVLFEGFNGASIMLHIATEGKAWLNREYLWYVFHYPFVELGVRKIISPIESTNQKCASFTENIGFTLEATLKDAAPNGDLLIYTFTKEQCRWLDLKDKYRGKTEGPSST